MLFLPNPIRHTFLAVSLMISQAETNPRKIDEFRAMVAADQAIKDRGWYVRPEYRVREGPYAWRVCVIDLGRVPAIGDGLTIYVDKQTGKVTKMVGGK